MINNIVTVAVDAMGGDNAPIEIIKGAIAAIKEKKNLNIILIGNEKKIKSELKFYSNKFIDKISIINSKQIIKSIENPIKAVQDKEESSIIIGLKLVKNKQADAFLSAGNSGAILAGSIKIIKKIDGIERTPLATLIPTKNNFSLLVDCGANINIKPFHLLQFAYMGSIYMQYIMKIDKPRIGLINVGIEEYKGNNLIKTAYNLLKQCDNINFIGNIESRDIPNNIADVIVTDAFVGNVILKLYEGLGSTLISKIKYITSLNINNKIRFLFVKDILKSYLKKINVNMYGGANILGINGIVIKCHGNSKFIEIKNSIIQCILSKKQNINKQIKKILN